MGLFFWKKNKEIDGFASDLANELYSEIQLPVLSDYFNPTSKDKKAAKLRNKADGKLLGLAKKIQNFRSENSIGVYGKARLHMKFKERLKELGYDDDIITQVNEYLMLKTP